MFLLGDLSYKNRGLDASSEGEAMAQRLILWSQTRPVSVEAVNDHNAALGRVESRLEGGAGRYALSVTGIGILEVDALCG